MKNARNTQKSEASVAVEAAPIFTQGTLPKLQNTVTADVLSKLLSHERMTGLETVFGAGTIRLAAVVEYLQRRYGWVISREDKVVGCSDGRVATVSEYFLLPEVIATAVTKGSDTWCTEVRAARLALRAKVAEAKRKADSLNAARRRHSLPGQLSLFNAGGM